MNLLDYYNYDYYDLGKTSFQNFQGLLILICGLVMSGLLMPIYYSFYNIAANKFKKRYPEERIVHIVKNGFLFMFIVTFCIGGFLGAFILPFFILKNVPSSETIFGNVYIAIVLWLVSVYGILERFAIIYVLSDKRIQLVRAMYPYNFNLKIKPFEYKNIVSVEYEKFITWEQLYIKFKDGSRYDGLMFFKQLKEVKSIIETGMTEEE